MTESNHITALWGQDQKIVSAVRWDGESMEVDDIRVLLADNPLPDWIIKAAQAGQLRCGTVGYIELRPAGSVVFTQDLQ